VVFEKCTRGYVRLLDPAAGRRRMAMDTFLKNVSGYLLEFAPTPDLPQIRVRSRVPAALARVRMLCPQLHRQVGKVMFVALAGQFAILAMPYFGRLVLDYVVSSDNQNLLNVLTLTFAGIFLAGTFSQYAQTYLTELVYGLVCVNVREGLVSHLLRNPIAFFEKRNVGDLFTRVKSQDEISTHAVKTTIATGVDLTVAVLALILMLLQSPRLTVVALAIFGFYVLVAVALFLRMLDARIFADAGGSTLRQRAYRNHSRRATDQAFLRRNSPGLVLHDHFQGLCVHARPRLQVAGHTRCRA